MPKTELYQIRKSSGKGKKIKPIVPHKIRALQVYNDFPEVKPIQNIMPDSKEEYWVALALYKLRLDFIFQRQVMGGRALRGGQVVDFWVYTVPKPSIILVQGDYWHYNAPNEYETLLKIAYLRSYYGGEINGVFELLTSEMPTPDMAYMLVRRKLRV
jgi:hypothetical protein